MQGSKGASAAPPTAFTITGAPYDGYSNFLQWYKPTFAGGFANYKIYRNGSVIETITNTSTQVDYYDYNSPVSYTTYNYKVRAYDLLGQYSESNTVSVTTNESTPPTFSGFTYSQDASNIYFSVNVADETQLYMILWFPYGYPVATSQTTMLSGTSAYCTYTRPKSSTPTNGYFTKGVSYYIQVKVTDAAYNETIIFSGNILMT